MGTALLRRNRCCARRLGAWAPAAALFTVLLPGAAPARAYVVNGPGWSDNVVELHIDPSFAVLTDDPLGLMQRVAGAWDEPGAPALSFQLSETPLARTASDDLNVVAAYTDEWPFDTGLIAATVTTRERLTRHIRTTDVYINAHNHQWEDGGFDLQSCLTHEFGHVLDLGDESDELTAVMYRRLARGFIKHETTDDDRKGLLAIYSGSGLAAAGCISSSIPSQSLGLPLLLLGMAALWLRRAGSRHSGVVVTAFGMLMLTGPTLLSAPAQDEPELFSDPAGITAVLRGHVVETHREGSFGPMPATRLVLKGTSCLAGRCPSSEVVFPGAVLDDGTVVELADASLPEVGDEVVLLLGSGGRSVHRHGASVGFVGTDVVGREVVAMGSRQSWRVHPLDGVVGKLRAVVRGTAAP